jgi:hypothetical protein
MPKFTKDHAERAAKKLKQRPANNELPRLSVREETDSAHVLQLVFCHGTLVTKFGIKHGSKRNAGHGWVPKALCLGPHRAVLFANCTMTVDQIVQHFIDSGLIE